MSNVVMVSADGHIGAPLEVYRGYLAAEYLDEYDAWLIEQRISEEYLRSFVSAKHEFVGRRPPLVATEPEDGILVAEVCDAAVRTAILENEGVVAEVLFPGPDFAHEMGFPFGPLASPHNKMLSATFFSDPDQRDVELNAAGQHAYNRWLADYCSEVAGRAVGLMHPPLHDMDAAVREVRWGREAGLRGVQIPSDDPRLPPYWDDYWVPFWQACEELKLPLHFHAGTSHTMEKGLPDGNDRVRAAVLAVEGPFWWARPLKILIYSGVMERHPELKFVFTELGSDWVPRVLGDMEWRYDEAMSDTSSGAMLVRPPSEYWYRQCRVGASLVSRDEVALRDQIGVNNMMYGVDFPHPEGSWGRTSEWLQQVFGSSGIRDDDLRRILGLNAVELYGLDLSQLQPIADRVGPSVEEISGASPRPRPEWGDTFAYFPAPYRRAGWSPRHTHDGDDHLSVQGIDTQGSIL